MSLTARPYRPDEAATWDAFIRASRNGTFLFERGYMDYHADRFTDASLVVVDEGRWRAVLPASRAEGVRSSHGGLTYGGLVLADDMGLAEAEAALGAVCTAAAAEGDSRLIYKTVPAIYHRAPAEEDRWALARAGARLIRRDALTVISPGAPEPSRMRRRNIAKAEGAGVEIGYSDDWSAFWAVLEERLGEAHGVAPVHSLAEITMLAGRFPQNIRLLAATRGAEMLGGMVLYATPTALHSQYTAGNAVARETRALDLLHAEAIGLAHEAGQVLDLGISSEEGGRVLNAGLQGYKESFGARAVMHDIYEVAL
ncbi:GNAT family N-acetyltransferase [Pseudoroseicyclus sp. H15]